MLLQPRPLAVGLQPGSVNYPMMYAVESGALASTGREVRVQVFRSANDALDALLSEAIFLDAVIPIQNIAAIQISNPGVIGIAALLLSDETHPLDHLVTLAESDIDSPADLRDKTLVVFPGSYSETVTSLALDRLGVTGVRFIKRTPDDMPIALRQGEADAGILYDPAATLAESQGWGRILESAFWERHLQSPLVVGAYAYNRVMAEREPALDTLNGDSRHGDHEAPAQLRQARSAGELRRQPERQESLVLRATFILGLRNIATRSCTGVRCYQA